MELQRFQDVLHAAIPDDGVFPNSSLPVLLYPDVVDPAEGEAASMFERLFAANSWGDGWRNGVYDYHHYHSTAHEALGVCRGSATLQLGGPRGITVQVAAGQCVVIPAGVAHRRIRSGAEFLVVGAYPQGQSLDLCTGRPGERPAADERIARLALPALDPVRGAGGPLGQLWR
jgi:uncharacterized protein YjlB